MPTYHVEVFETRTQVYAVEAIDEQEAEQLIYEDEGEWLASETHHRSIEEVRAR
jgi:hypothetical protein